MRKFLLIGAIIWSAFSFSGCNNQSGNGELIGIQGRGRWNESLTLWYGIRAKGKF